MDVKLVQETAVENVGPVSGRSEKDTEKDYLASLSTIELFAYRKNKLAEKKQKIVSLAHAVLEDPQNNVIFFNFFVCYILWSVIVLRSCLFTSKIICRFISVR